MNILLTLQIYQTTINLDRQFLDFLDLTHKINLKKMKTRLKKARQEVKRKKMPY
jgi:hypothetical protein